MLNLQLSINVQVAVVLYVCVTRFEEMRGGSGHVRFARRVYMSSKLACRCPYTTRAPDWRPW
jgi:hypothetical protein